MRLTKPEKKNMFPQTSK